MNSTLQSKVNRINELFIKAEMKGGLTENEMKEQLLLREELVNYFKYAISKHSENIKK